MVLEVEVRKVTRLRNTTNGNPVFQFETNCGTFKTKPNTTLGAWIPPESRFVGETILINVDGNYITGIVEKK